MTHQRAFELLPWLANGSLGMQERDLVDQHVRSCLSCHRELKEQQRLRAALRAQPAVHISPQSGFEKLTRELGGTASFVAPRARPFATFARYTSVTAAGVALIGVLMWLVSAPGRDDYVATFETLATTPADATPAIDVIFMQTITAAEMQQLLVEIDGSIASGPSEIGRYTVRLDHAGADGVALDTLLARLQRDPRVRFAGPAMAAGRTP